MRHLMRLARCCVALALIGQPAQADDAVLPHQLSWKQWTVAEGLPQITVTAIVQDDDGYLWVGTQDGIARFDGLRFAHYGLGEHPALGHAVVHALALAGDDALWIGTMGGVARLHGGQIAAVASDPAEDVPGMVLSLTSGRDGRIWVAARNGVFRSDGGRLRRVATGLEPMPALKVLIGDDGVPTAVMPGHLVIDPEGQRRTVDFSQQLPSALTALRTSEGLWLGTIGGLYLLDAQGQVQSAHAPHREVEQLVADAEGTLWIATDQGLWRRRPGEAAQAVSVPGIEQRAWVRALTVDREANLWVGTQLSGLHRAYAGRFRRLGPRDGLPEGAVWAVYAAPDGELWAGTPDGVYRGGFAGFRAAVPVDSLPHPMVVGVLRDRRGGVWFGTRYGLAHLAPGASRAVVVKEVGEDLIAALIEDDDGSLLVGGLGGLFRIRDRKVSREPLPPQDTASSVNALARDADGRIWAGYEQGAAVLVDGAWLPAPGSADGGMQIMSLAPYGQRRMLAAAFEGLFLLDESGVQRLGREHGLHIDWVTATAQQDDELWYLSVRGIGRIGRDALDRRLAGGTDAVRARVFGEFGDSVLAQCNGGHQAAIAVTGGRWLWCPSLDGMLVLDLAKARQPTPAPAVRIEAIASASRQVITNADAARIALGADERDLRIDFTAMQLRAPEQVRFEAQLQGYDRDWLPLETRRSAYYTNLAPGHYRFAVRALGEDGQPGAASMVAVDIAPRWHETWLARAGAVLLLVLAGWALMQGRLRLVQRQRERLALKVAERTRELQDANRRLEEASLTDPLTALHNRRFLGQHLPAEVARVDRLHAEGHKAAADLVFLHLDLDHFKTINDRHGHAVGDEVLVEVARRLRALARGSDLVLRWGGEEFLLVGRDSDRRHARAWAQRVLDALREAPVATRAGPLAVTGSLGYAAYPALPGQPAGFGWEQVLDLADAATYLAKREGRDRAVGLRLCVPVDAASFVARLHSHPQALAEEGLIAVER